MFLRHIGSASLARLFASSSAKNHEMFTFSVVAFFPAVVLVSSRTALGCNVPVF